MINVSLGCEGGSKRELMPCRAGHKNSGLSQEGKRTRSLNFVKLRRLLTRGAVALGGVLWRISHAGWNRLMHTLHGNTATGSGGPPRLPAWLHSPGWTGAPVIAGRVTEHWRYATPLPAPIFDVWAMEPPGSAAQPPASLPDPVPAPAVTQTGPPATAAAIGGTPPGGVWTLEQIVAAVRHADLPPGAHPFTGLPVTPILCALTAAGRSPVTLITKPVRRYGLRYMSSTPGWEAALFHPCLAVDLDLRHQGRPHQEESSSCPVWRPRFSP